MTATWDQQTAQSETVFDKKDQYDKIVAGLMPGETVHCVYDSKGMGTGFIGITDRRVVLQDNSFVGGKVALTSIPYSKVNTVSFVSDKSKFGKLASSSAIAIQVGSTQHQADFRGHEKAQHAHNLILHFMVHGPS